MPWFWAHISSIEDDPLKPTERLANAVYQAVSGVASGLSAHRLVSARQHLEGADGIPGTVEARALIMELPEGEDDYFVRVTNSLKVRTERILASRALAGLTISLIVVQAVTGVLSALITVGMLLFYPNLLATGSDRVLVLLMSISAAASTACLGAGLFRLRDERIVAIEWFQRAVLIDLLVTQLLDSVLSGFRTVFSVFIGLFILAVLAAEKTRLLAQTAMDAQTAKADVVSAVPNTEETAEEVPEEETDEPESDELEFEEPEFEESEEVAAEEDPSGGKKVTWPPKKREVPPTPTPAPDLPAGSRVIEESKRYYRP